VLRAQKEVGRSSYGAIFVGRYATGNAPELAKWNRAYGVDANIQMSPSQRLSTFVARTDSPDAIGSDYAGRAFYNFTNNLWQISGGYSQVGERFNPEVGFLPRRGYRRPEFRVFFQPQPKTIVDPAGRAALLVQQLLGVRRATPELDDACAPVRDSARRGRPVRLVLRSQSGQPADAVRGL
jgi:hypothetical protein